ncbi:putative NACHT domain-containing protein [Seiridium unicorne]|uniref:NACHT domain-containing protein n=1 Tax=Seiridium unicorne TaxID=138068 RepID=A0ABR2UIK4_9PEZI
MDSIKALNIATAILAVVDSIVDFSLQDYTSMTQTEQERKTTLLSALIAKLSSKTASQQTDQLLYSTRPSPNTLALENLASTCLRESQKLVQPFTNSGKVVLHNTELFSKPNEGTPTGTAMGQSHAAEFRAIAQNVTLEMRIIISSRMTELNQTAQLLKGGSRHARPEQESRVDTLCREIDDLSQLLRRRSPDEARVGEPFTTAELHSIRARLVLIAATEDKVLADKIVASLNYSSRAARQGSVPQAHRDTFQWAFDSKLSDWFSRGNGIFWIAGRPGSGKSTFMKFITNQVQTKRLLTSWAGHEDTLAVATHFFWIAGTPIQKSWQGLLQSLLFDILDKHPSLIAIISPARWAAAKAGKWQVASEPWSVTELTASLRALANADGIPVKVCFFIDGLDEYESNHDELCKVLCDMAKSPHVKMCVSSRPWPVFEQSFGGDGTKMLHIHELTRHDVKRFVGTQLQSHPHWDIAVSRNRTSLQEEIIEHIAAQANGVFLWAYFATRSLREGLDRREMIGDLHIRLNDLPTALDSLFKQMLESIPILDHPKMASILQAASHALEPLHIDLYWHIEREYAEHNYAFKCPIGTEKQDYVIERRHKTMESINEKSKGLLKMVDHHVEFVHRTVKDFVLTRDMGDYLRGKLPADYNGFVSIATAYLGFLKTSKQDNYLFADIVRLAPGQTSGPFISHLNRALIYVSEALKSSQNNSRRQAFVLLDHYEDAVAQMVRIGHITLRGLNAQTCDPRLAFREELIRHDVTPYIIENLERDHGFFDVFDESPLFAMLTPMALSSGESPAPVPGNLRLILEQGYKPNSRSKISDAAEYLSPWAGFARSAMSVFNMLSGPCMFPALRWNDSLDKGIFDLLLSYGADPNQPLVAYAGSHTAFSHFLDISLSKFLGAECFEGYLRTLDAFLRAGASLGIPVVSPSTSEGDVAVGNLARQSADESILASYCAQLKELMPRLSADLERARFVSLVTEKVVLSNKLDEKDFGVLSEATLAGVPTNIADPLLQLIQEERDGNNSIRSMKRSRQSGDFGGYQANAKHFKQDTLGR